MKFNFTIAAGLLLLGGCVPAFPVLDAEGAIAVAKRTCAKQLAKERMAPMRWSAAKVDGQWQVVGFPDKISMGYAVQFSPVGPMPTACQDAAIIAQ